MPRSRRTRHTSLSGTAVSRAAGRESAADAQGADIEDRMRSTATSTPSGPAASSACLACSRVHPQISTIVSMLAAWSPCEVGGEAARTAKSTLTATEVGDATITLTSGEGEDRFIDTVAISRSAQEAARFARTRREWQVWALFPC